MFRPSWDPLTLVAAVRSERGVGCEETGVGGRNEVEVDGHNVWVEEVDGGTNQTYLLLNVRFLKLKMIFYILL